MEHLARTHAWKAATFLAASLLIVQGVQKVEAQAAEAYHMRTQDVAQTSGSVAPEPLAEFRLRLQRYDDLRRRLDSSLPVQTVSSDPGTICEVVKAHQAALRAARSRAVQGDVFFTGIADLIRSRIREYLHGVSAREFLAMITEADAPPMPRPCVNRAYPADGAVTTMPAHLLQVLPALPRGVEYRFIDRDLILWDPHANLIVDFIPDAIDEDL